MFLEHELSINIYAECPFPNTAVIEIFWYKRGRRLVLSLVDSMVQTLGHVPVVKSKIPDLTARMRGLISVFLVAFVIHAVLLCTGVFIFAGFGVTQDSRFVSGNLRLSRSFANR